VAVLRMLLDWAGGAEGVGRRSKLLRSGKALGIGHATRAQAPHCSWFGRTGLPGTRASGTQCQGTGFSGGRPLTNVVLLLLLVVVVELLLVVRLA